MPARIAFLILLIATAIPSPWMSPAVALGLGIAFGLLAPHPYPAGARAASRLLLQASVVALGFGMNLHDVLRAGQAGFLYTLVGIAFALVVGMLIARALAVPGKIAYLIAVGTAICGGSAIAAVGPTVDATDEEMSVSIGTIFLLNAIALVAFPPIGRALDLSEPQFGLWAALAIHDTSSVVGAGAKFGAVALTIATTVKLARALWIVPVTLSTAAVRARQQRQGDSPIARAPIAWPWFIGLFVGAAVLNTYVGALAPASPWLLRAGRVGLTVTLFLIGTGLSRASIKAVGVRPLVLGVVLWVIVATLSLLVIRADWIAIG